MRSVNMRLMIYEYSSYSNYLRDLLEARQASNRAYSLRAMAKSLELSPSTLSDVLNGRKNFSERTAEYVAVKLNLSGRKAKYFNTLVQYASTKNEDFKLLLTNQLRILNPKMREQFEGNVAHFRFMSDWHHTAILEMTFLPNQQMDPESIAHKLEITATQAREALELLQKLELIRPTGPGCYEKTHKKLVFQTNSPNQALRKFHHQMLGKAQESLATQSSLEKLVGSETFPMGIEDLSEANDIVEGCFQQILELSKRSQNKTHVYHLGIQLFQISKGTKK